MFTGMFQSFLIFHVIVSFDFAKIVNITVTTNTIDVISFGNIMKQFLPLSGCPNTYTVSIIPYNQTIPFNSPVNQNNYFPNIHLVFGPIQYFSPAYFGFPGSTNIFNFPLSYILDSFMNIPLRLQLMMNVTNLAVANDVNKSVVFILNGTNIDPSQPWKTMNVMPYLSSFMGTMTVLKYSSTNTGISICKSLVSSSSITFAMDLNTVAALDVLSSCINQNLLNWRIRWLVFFSSISYFNQSVLNLIPMRPNFTIYDFTHSSDFSTNPNQAIFQESDIVLSDISYTTVKLMDFSECPGNPSVPILNLRTGQFSFTSGTVTRINWLLDIYRTNGTLTKVGNVTIINGVITINQPQVPLFNISNIVNEMRSKPFRVAVMNENPFGYNDAVNGSLIITGYCVDMIVKILTGLNVSYKMINYDLANGMSSPFGVSGMLGLLTNGVADIVVGPITQNPAQASIVDFTISFASYRVSVIYKTNVTNPYVELFDFIFAFDQYIWILIIVGCVIYAAVLTLVNMISPNEANFNFVYSFLLTMGSMVQGVTTSLPDKVSGKIIVVFWWIFNISVLLAYVANYGAIRTNRRMQTTIKSVTDLFLQNQYSYGTVVNSAIDYYLQTSSNADIQSVNQVIRTQYAALMATSTDLAMGQVRNIGYAFIYADVVLQHFSNESCITLTNGTDQFNFTFALPLNSDYTNLINLQIAGLDPKFIASLNQKYFPVIKSNPVCLIPNWLTTITSILGTQFIPSAQNSLNIDSTGGIFVVMLVGIISALFCAMVEIIVKKVRQRNKPKTKRSA